MFVVLVCKKKTVRRVVRRISNGTKTDHTESVTSRLYRSSTYVTRLYSFSLLVPQKFPCQP